MRRILFLAPALLVLSLNACQDPVIPMEPGTYVLVELNSQPLPAPLDSSPVGSVEVLDGSLRLEPWSRRAGRVYGSGRLLISQAGFASRSENTTATGTYVRTADQLKISFENGATHTFRVEAQGTRLRTTGSTCAGLCTDILHVYVYERQ